MCVRWGGRCSLRCRCGRPLMQLSKEALWCQMWMSEVKALISLFFCRLISAITRLMSPQPSCVSQCRCRWFAAVHVITDAQTQHDSQSHRCSRLCCKVIRIIYYWRRVDAQAAAAWRKTPTGRDSESSRRSQESEELTPELLIVRPQPWIKRQPDDKTASFEVSVVGFSISPCCSATDYIRPLKFAECYSHWFHVFFYSTAWQVCN